MLRYAERYLNILDKGIYLYRNYGLDWRFLNTSIKILERILKGLRIEKDELDKYCNKILKEEFWFMKIN